MQAAFDVIPAFLTAASNQMPSLQTLEGLSPAAADLAIRNATHGTPEAMLIADAMKRVADLGLEVRAESGARIETKSIQVARFPIGAFLPAETQALLASLGVDVSPPMMTINLAGGRGDAA
jgi:hypothetical protein